MTRFKIEAAKLEDVPGMRACVRRAYQMYVDRIGKEPGPMIDDYEFRVKNNDAFVVKNQDKIVGVLVIIRNEEQCLLDNVAVNPSSKGMGLGRGLVEYAEKFARENHYNQLELYTHEMMTENIVMYEKWGYQEIRRVTEKGFDRVYMRKAV